MKPNQSRIGAFTFVSVGLMALWGPGSGAAARARSFTLEEVLSAPLVEDSSVSRNGPVAWVANRRGSRNVWIATPAAGGGYGTRELTHYSGDDGTEIGGLAWGRDGKVLVYVRGDDENPLSLPLGPPTPSAIWAISLNGSTPRLIGPGSEPVVSPTGDQVAYLDAGALWIAKLNGASAPVAVLRDERAIMGFTWSPDGRRIAFVSVREPGRGFDNPRHSFIGVLGLADHHLVWMAPSFDHDISPVWSSDGRRLAFVRVPVDTSLSDERDERSGTPWSIWVGDPSTGQTSRVWQADAGAGSMFYPGVDPAALLWGAGNRLIFKWERTGWLNLYAVSSQGGAAVALATGPYEVASMILTPDRRTVIFSSNKNDIDRRHVWKVPVVGGPVLPLTRGSGIEDSPAMTANGELVVLHGDARLPLEPSLVRENGAFEPLNPGAIPRQFPAAQLVIPQDITFRSPDGLEVHGQLFLPSRATRGVRHPAIVFYHGGPVRQMLLGWHPIEPYSYLYGENQYFASRGYVVLSVNYRGGVGYGLDFRTPAHFGPKGASEYQDIRGAALYLRSRADVNAKRIGVYGGSYGGLMTGLALARASDLYAAGVTDAGLYDWRATLVREARANDAYVSPAQLQLAYDSSAIASVKSWRSPVLIVHSDDDHNVNFLQSEELIAALRANGLDPKSLVKPNETHDMQRYATWLEFLHATDDFFAAHFGLRR